MVGVVDIDRYRYGWYELYITSLLTLFSYEIEESLHFPQSHLEDCFGACPLLSSDGSSLLQLPFPHTSAKRNI